MKNDLLNHVIPGGKEFGGEVLVKCVCVCGGVQLAAGGQKAVKLQDPLLPMGDWDSWYVSNSKHYFMGKWMIELKYISPKKYMWILQ